MFGPAYWRFGRAADPFSQVERLQREINQLFSGIDRSHGTEYPALNVWISEDSGVVTAELPGMDPEKLNLSVERDILTVSGAREPERLREGESFHRQERSFGGFSRTIRLPFAVAADKVEAQYEKGVLSIRLPRAEEDKPKKITIKSE